MWLQRWMHDRGRWLVLAAAVHALGVLGFVARSWWLASGEQEMVPIPVTLLEIEEPPEPPPDKPPEFLHFRKPTHPRVRESLEVPQEILALVPPPMDAVLSETSSGGGISMPSLVQPSESAAAASASVLRPLTARLAVRARRRRHAAPSAGCAWGRA